MAAQRRLARALLLGIAATAIDTPAAAIDDRKLYILHCSGCHGLNGQGLPENGIPALHDAGRWATLPAGRAYLVQVPGIAASQIDDTTAARLLNYSLRTYAADQLGPAFQAFDADEVRRLRTGIATDPERRRQNLERQLEQQQPTATAEPPREK